MCGYNLQNFLKKDYTSDFSKGLLFTEVVWAATTILLDHNFAWPQFCLTTILLDHNFAWPQFRLTTIFVVTVRRRILATRRNVAILATRRDFGYTSRFWRHIAILATLFASNWLDGDKMAYAHAFNFEISEFAKKRVENTDSVSNNHLWKPYFD